MNHIRIFIGILLISGFNYGQQIPTGTAGAGPDWRRGGNLPVGATPPTSNIFGTMWNSPIYTYTDGFGRMKLNGSLGSPTTPQYAVDGYTTGQGVNASGYLWLGHSTTFASTNYNTAGAFSLLHLNGRDGSFVQDAGYRSWMKTGITFTDNNDMSYMGIRKVGGGFDVTETVINWSDNAGLGPGPDDVALRFSGSGAGSTFTDFSNLRNVGDYDGLHVGRFCSDGLIGFGDVFGAENISPSNAGYIRPKSLLHLSYDRQSGTPNEPYGFLQITYRYTGLGGGENFQDGLRLGIDNDQYIGNGLHGFLRWQERTPFIVQTDFNDNNTDNSIENSERMRISSVKAPGVLVGTYDPVENVTRVSVNYHGDEPINSPNALLQLGKNATLGAEYDITIMDYGTLVDDGSRALFTGITPPSYSDPLQSVLSFGGKDMVFIEANDREVARFDKGNNNMGIGDFSPTGAIENSSCTGPPSERIDVEGNARLRNVPTEESEYIMLGKKQCEANPDDIAFRKLAFPDDPNLYLDGTGNWTAAGDGLHCWDLNSNGIFDVATEDMNGNGIADIGDCQGPQGVAGANGLNGTNGTDGTNGLNSLIRTFPLSVGSASCPNGGVRIWSGVDLNNDGILQLGERTSNRVVCNGLDGVNGANGINGSSALVNTTVEPAGPNCTFGGTLIESGTDINNDNILQPGEITGSEYVCNGAPGPAGPMGPAGSINGAHNGCSISNLDPSKVALGHHINGSGAELLNDRIVPMNGHNIYFTNNGVNNTFNRIGLGTSTSASAKFHINVDPTDQNSTTLMLDNSSEFGSTVGINLVVDGNNILNPALGMTGLNYGERSFVSGGQNRNINKELNATGGDFAEGIAILATNGTKSNIGLIARANNTNGLTSTDENSAITGLVGNGRINYGGFFVTMPNATANTLNEAVHAFSFGTGTNNFGVRSYAEGGTVENYGIRTGAAFNPAATNYGIRAGVGSFNNNDWAGWFDGNMHVTGQISSTNGTIILSDEMFKTNVNNIENAMEIIQQIEPKTYFLDTINFADFGFETDKQMGVIAQDLEPFLSNIVTTNIRPAQYDSLGNQTKPELSYKSVEYMELIPLLIAGAKEQQIQIEEKDSIITAQQNQINDMNARLSQIESCLANLGICEMNQSVIQRTPEEIQHQLTNKNRVTLSDKNTIVLMQNVPNPYSESTVIEYNIPASIQKAQIQFFDGLGKLINSVNIVDRGRGELTVFASDLSSGMYTYSLVADGKVVATKKMVKQ